MQDYVAEEHDGDEPGEAGEEGGLFVAGPDEERDETPVGIEHGGDKPRVAVNLARNGEERALRAGPARDAEHGGDDYEKKRAKEEEHGSVKIVLVLLLLPVLEILSESI